METKRKKEKEQISDKNQHDSYQAQQNRQEKYERILSLLEKTKQDIHTIIAHHRHNHTAPGAEKGKNRSSHWYI